MIRPLICVLALLVVSQGCTSLYSTDGLSVCADHPCVQAHDAAMPARAPGCSPLTCGELTCGQVDDGCGGTLDCDNGLHDADETDVDCGGDPSTCATRCQDAKACFVGSDCNSGNCNADHDDICGVGWWSSDSTSLLPNVALAENYDVAFGPDGSVVHAGMFLAQPVGEAGPLWNVYVVKYDAASGDPAWSAPFELATAALESRDEIDVVVRSDGNVAIAGVFRQDIVQPPLWLVDSQDEGDIFVILLDGDTGVPIWAKSLGDAGLQIAYGIASDPNDDELVVVGGFNGMIAGGGPPLVAIQAPVGDDPTSDMFVIRLRDNGAIRWKHQAGDEKSQVAYDVAIAADGATYVTGELSGYGQFNQLGVNAVGASSDMIVARFEPDGIATNVAVFGDANHETAQSVALTPEGDVVIAGYSHQKEDGVFAGLVWKLDATLTELWSVEVADEHVRRATGVAVDSTGNIVVGGTYKRVGQEVTHAFLLRLGGSGDQLGQLTLDSDDNHAIHDVAVDAYDNVGVAGLFNGSLSFGAIPEKNALTDAGFTAKLPSHLVL
jgi:hypothetical protein